MVAPAKLPDPLPPPLDRHLWELRPVRDLFWLLVVVLVVWLGYRLQAILVPLSLAWALAYLFNPLVEWAERRWRWPRWLTVWLLLLLLVGVCAGTVALLGPLLVRQALMFIGKLPQYLQDLASRYGIEAGTLAEQAARLAEQARENPAGLFQSVFTGTGRVLGFLGSLIGSTVHMFVGVALWLVFFVYFAMKFPDMAAWFYRLVPAARRDDVRGVLGEIDESVGGFFRARLIISLCVGVLFSFGWWLAAVPYWFLLGMLSGILNIVPYASTMGWPLAVLLKYLDTTTGPNAAQFTWTGVVLWPSVAYFVVQGLDEWVLRPWIGSRATNINAVTVLLALVAGEALAGFYGMVLAVPAAICLKILLSNTLLPRCRRWAG